jgi:hypothetical protein
LFLIVVAISSVTAPLATTFSFAAVACHGVTSVAHKPAGCLKVHDHTTVATRTVDGQPENVPRANKANHLFTCVPQTGQRLGAVLRI